MTYLEPIHTSFFIRELVLRPCYPPITAPFILFLREFHWLPPPTPQGESGSFPILSTSPKLPPPIREKSSLSTNYLFYRLATSYRQREVRIHCNGYCPSEKLFHNSINSCFSLSSQLSDLLPSSALEIWKLIHLGEED